ncbi:MAG TPA: ankyrin repeat domain-containing protein, partial [Desulfomonilaceae bacterium]|nr:ankyrin repeat domain-containing protein [Desulfomonilaceae bacterium]
ILPEEENGLVREKDIDAALVAAIHEGRAQEAAELLDRGADANCADKRGSPVLVLAVTTGSRTMVELLLRHRADAGSKDRHGFTALARACEQEKPDLIEPLLQHKKGQADAEMLDASEKGRTNWIKLMADRGADIDARNNEGATPLMLAAANGHLELVQLLLAKGADRTAQDKKGFTALGWAYSPMAMHRTPLRVQREIIKLLK